MAKRNLLNLYECAERLQVSAAWLKRAAKAEKIPCLRLGKRDVRFDLSAVRAAIADMAKKPSKDKKGGKTILGVDDEK